MTSAPSSPPTDDTVLPTFRYHPDPIATGSIVASDAACEACKKPRGYVYTASAYCTEEYDECICPWCIADGSAAKTFDATFFDDSGVGRDSDPVSAELVNVIITRTPGFSGLQGERWWTHCSQPAAFLGRRREE